MLHVYNYNVIWIQGPKPLEEKEVPKDTCGLVVHIVVVCNKF